MTHLGRSGKLPRIKVKCVTCGVWFTVQPSVYRMKMKSANKNMFHNRKCYFDWQRAKNNEAKTLNIVH